MNCPFAFPFSFAFLFSIFCGFSLFSLGACSFNESRGPDVAPPNALGPGDVEPAPQPAKTPGPITLEATEECIAERQDSARTAEQASSSLVVKPAAGGSFSKVLISDGQSVVYLRSELDLFLSGLYSVQVSREDGKSCWFTLDIDSSQGNINLTLRFKD